MRRLLIGLAMACSATSAWAGDRETIIQAEREISEAYVTGQGAAVARYLSDDYRGIGSRGELSDKEAALAEIRGGVGESAAELESIEVQFRGDTAIARIREKDRGETPHFALSWRVITDTWIKRKGTWQLIAAEELDPGAPTLPANSSAIGEIKTLRQASNQAIAAHDMAAFLPVFAEDATFVWSDGSSARGKAELQARLAEDFANPAFVAYVRSPGSVSIADSGVRAVEHGTWSALKREERGETRYSGDYMAHWSKTAEGWRIRGEVYVKLRCDGPLCKP